MADHHPRFTGRTVGQSPLGGMTTVTLAAAPAPAPLLARGVLRSPFKRPSPEAGFPRARLVLPGVRLDLARLAAYERVCGFPTGDDALPVTYPHVLGFPLAMRLMSDRAFPLPLPGLVHTSIEITGHTPLPATGVYELAVHVEGLAPHRRGTEATVVTGVRADGEVVWESRSTYLARHRTDVSGQSPAAPAPPSTCIPSPPASSASHGPSRTACGRSPAAWPPTESRTGRWSGPGSGRRCCCPRR